MMRILPLILLVLSMAYTAQASESLKPYRMTSGIKKTIVGSFILKKEHVQDITTEVIKASRALPGKSQFFFYTHREDNRYFEVGTIDELFSDPNSAHSKIEYLSWNLLDLEPKEYQGGEKARLALQIQYQATPSVIKISVDGDDMAWALVTTDAIMKNVRRTTKSRINVMHIVTILLGTIAYLFFARLLLKLISIIKFKSEENEALSTILLQMPIYMIPMFVIFPLVYDFGDVVAWINYAPSYFLWGDMLQEYGESNNFQQNVFWGALISFFISIVANIATVKLMHKRSNEENFEKSGDDNKKKKS